MRGQVKVYQKKLVLKRRRRIFYISFYSIVGLGLIFAGLSYVSQMDALLLREVSVRGNVRMLRSDVETIVKSSIAGNYGNFFSKANAFLYPHNDLEKTLLAVPVVKEVNVSRSGFNTIVVNITERSEVARWCNEGASDENPCFSLDENGLVFAPIGQGCDPHVCMPEASSTRDMYLYRGIITDGALGKQALTAVDFKKIQFFMNDLKNLSVDPIEASFSSTTNYMTILLGGGGKIVVNTGDDLSATLQNISTVLKDRSVAPSFSDFLARLDYIKFDAGNKVVYKMRVETIGKK